MTEFLAMGGYAFYVWGSYGITALVLIAELFSLRLRRRAALDEARSTVPDNMSGATGGVL
jgi:heme exporter protein D